MKNRAIALLVFALLLLGLEAWGGSYYLTGRITFGPSTPARSVWIMVFDGPNLVGRSLTGDDGRYYLGGLEPKIYTLVVKREASGENLLSQTVVLPQDQVHDIALP